MEVEKDNRRLKGKAVVVEEMATSTSCSKINSLPINEAPKNGESLTCNSVGLETFANNPVLDSSCMPDIVRSDVAMEDTTNQQPHMENQSKHANLDTNPVQQMENQRKDATLPPPQSCLNTNNDEANLKKATSHQTDVHHPSLMKPNSSARTHEVNVFCNFLFFWLIPFYSKNTSLLQQNIAACAQEQPCL